MQVSSLNNHTATIMLLTWISLAFIDFKCYLMCFHVKKKIRKEVVLGGTLYEAFVLFNAYTCMKRGQVFTGQGQQAPRGHLPL